MDKNDFINAIFDPSLVSDADIKKLETIIKSHSYSSLPYFLIAKHYYNSNDIQKDKALQLASAYATERKLLKKFIVDDTPVERPARLSSLVEENIVQDNEIQSEEENTKVVEISNSQSLSEKENILESDVAEEVSDNLEELKNLQQQLLSTDVTSALSKEDLLSEYNVEDYNYFEEIEGKDVEEIHEVLPIKETNGIEEPRLEEVESEAPEDLIDRFLRLRPSIIRSSLNQLPPEQEDLAEKNLEEDTELVSENLAVILAKQGKREKAIDLYKKLIWKYPQKKSYFADRIEELKK